MLSQEKRSKIMSAIRSKGNRTTELALIKLMRSVHIQGWRRGFKLSGSPDFVFPLQRVAVFVDGDFWHGNPRTYRPPKTNVKYWNDKIILNRARDRQINSELRRKGWLVLRIWESALATYPFRVAKRLEKALKHMP